MVLHGDCPARRIGEQPPNMKLVKVTPDGRTVEFLCFGCQGKVRFTQKILAQPKAPLPVVESARSGETDDPSGTGVERDRGAGEHRDVSVE